jgi:hypothetical protein
VLQIGVDAFVAQLPRNAGASAAGAFPRLACLIATDFPTGGSVDQRELFSQDRVRKGVAACLTALDAAGASSVMMPLLGAASAETQSKDPVFEGQRLLKECRHLNAAAGIALGVHDFIPGRRTLREIGIVQWNQEISQMFSGSRLAQTAYRLYAEQIKQAVNKGIAGEKTTALDVGGNTLPPSELRKCRIDYSFSAWRSPSRRAGGDAVAEGLPLQPASFWSSKDRGMASARARFPLETRVSARSSI